MRALRWAELGHVEGLGFTAARSTSSDKRMAENLKLFGWVPAAD